MGVTVGPGVGEYNDVDFLIDGEEASQVILNRPLINLENRTDALKTSHDAEILRLDNVESVAYAQADRISTLEPMVQLHQDILEVIEPLALTALQPFPVVIATADFTPETDKVYVLDPALTTMTVSLPAPAQGTVITLKSLALTNPNANIIVARYAGENIDGAPEDYEFSQAGQTATFVSDGTDWFLTSTGGGTGTGDAFGTLERMRDRLENSSFEYLGYAVFTESEEGLIDLPNSTVTISPSDQNSVRFTAIGQVLQSKSLLSSDFLLGVNNAPEDEPRPLIDISRVEALFYYELSEIDPTPTLEISRDGSEFQALAANRVGNSDLFRAEHTFTDEAVNAYTQAVGGATSGTLDLTDANSLNRLFTLPNATTIKDVLGLGLTVTGSPLGYLDIKIVRDDTGSPSTDPNDVIAYKKYDIPTLVTGSIDVPFTAPCEADSYHIVLETDYYYKAEYTNSAGANKISFDEDGSGITYTVEGRELNLILKVTSGTAETLLHSFGVIYYPDQASNLSTGDYSIHKVSFDGIVDNENSFVLPFTPTNPELLMVLDLDAGQTWKRGANSFSIAGNIVTFEPNFFNREGIVNLEFIELIGSIVDNTQRVMAILANSNLASIDSNIDLGVAGKGIMLKREGDGVIRELTINQLDQIVIKATS